MCNELINLLKTFDLVDILDDLISAGVTFRSLQYLNERDIAHAIKNIGKRSEFREKLFVWQKEQPLEDILKYTSGGQSVIEFYKLYNKLNESKRRRLIDVILEYVFDHNIMMKSVDFADITHQIGQLFPQEKTVLDYYYIPRKSKQKSCGKLYSKYFNIQFKKKKENTSEASLQSSPSLLKRKPETVEFDCTILAAIKTELQRSIDDWTFVCDKWERTFPLRQREIKLLDNITFLQQWPKFKDSRAPSLIDIDFNFIHDGKLHLLKAKWNLFKEKIKMYYQLHLKNAASKAQLKDAIDTPNNDAEDYILVILLNAVLKCTTGYMDKSGKRKRATIKDGEQCFILHLVSINDIDHKISEIIDRCYTNNSTVQPFLIVEGSDITVLKSFYVYFDNIFYKRESFVDALDCTFKIYQVFNFSYKPICALAWTFIQQFFYDIHSEIDVKSATLCSLINYMKAE